MIRLDGVGRSFGSRVVLRDVTLEVRPGEIVALVGPNGAGKSTTLRILAGIIQCTTGTASIDGRDVITHGTLARRRLGYLPQKTGMPLDAVVRDLFILVAAVRGMTDSEARRALTTLDLGHRLDARLSELSGGERQRVMLGLATMGDLHALLLDEPSISLDSEGAGQVREAIRGAAETGCAVLFASHHLSDVAALADRIAVMVDGCVVAQGTLAELAMLAGCPATTVAPELSPIERVYQTLVTRARGGDPGYAGSAVHELRRRGAA